MGKLLEKYPVGVDDVEGLGDLKNEIKTAIENFKEGIETDKLLEKFPVSVEDIVGLGDIKDGVYQFKEGLEVDKLVEKFPVTNGDFDKFEMFGSFKDSFKTEEMMKMPFDIIKELLEKPKIIKEEIFDKKFGTTTTTTTRENKKDIKEDKMELKEDKFGH